MNPLVQNFLLASLLPSTVFILLIGLVALLGIARWRRTLLVLALVALALRVLGIVLIYMPYWGVAHTLPIPVIELLLTSGSPMVNLSINVTTVGIFLALVLAARGRLWGWFAAILLAATIGSGAVNFAFSYYGLLVFLGTPRAMQLYAQPSYVIITNVIAGLNIVVMLLYALLSPRTTAAMPTAVSTASMSDDVTLP